MARNIEIKARCDSLADAREIARGLATEYVVAMQQTDTYFNCQQGRLKLREIDDGTVQLIAYRRPDSQQPSLSDYQLCPLDAAEPLKQALANTLGVWLVVSKQRDVFLSDKVRIHLDKVDRLGAFIEFEDVLADDEPAAGGRVDELMQVFAVRPEQLVAESYSDLLAAANTGGP